MSTGRISVLAGAILPIFSGCSSEKESVARPNIIMFMVDDMGWQDTSVPFWKEKTPFNLRYRTPARERLASEGMMFTQAYASSVSSPTRVSLMTGMNAARHRVTNWTLKKDHWFIQNKGVLADGRKASMVNVIKQVDQNSFTWQTVERTVGGELLPNIDEVLIARE